MKIFLAFILISAGSLSTALACGPYYPYGEAVRFSLFRPQVFQTQSLNAYHFSAESFRPDDESVRLGEDLNCALWQQRCGTAVPLSEIHHAVYGSDVPSGAFMQALVAKKDKLAINYLKFANECASFNSYYDDPWERSEHTRVPKRDKLIRKALKSAAGVKDGEISRRYAFLAIRMAFYNENYELIATTYDRYFAGRKEHNIIDYWSLYFRSVAEQDPATRNFMAAQVFLHAPDKRFVVHQHYDKTVPLTQTLALASTDEKRSAVWALDAVRNHGKAIDNIRHILQLDPKSEMLSLLLLREVNKLEDWIYTPYYSGFGSSLSSDYWEDKTEEAVVMSKRIGKDRAYARQLLELVKTVGPATTEHPQLWKSARIYLSCMTQDFTTSLELMQDFHPTGAAAGKLNEQLDIIRALCLTAQQPADSAVILADVKPILLRESARGNDRFLFAIARELEYKGNTTDAAILLSTIGRADHSDADFGNISEQYWKSKSGFQTLYSDVYYDYFFYLDAEYTPGEVQALISQVSSAKTDNAFEQWKYGHIRQDIPRLYDLLGTKYMRKNQYSNAYSAFRKVDDTLWTSDLHPYKRYLDANPFYTNLYNEHSPTEADKLHFNKESLVRRLIEYLGKAEDPKTTNRDYYYFLVANCQLNMTQYGNSWLMKRYYWTSAESLTGLEDDNDYFYCDEAKKYYLKAKSVSSSRKFQALCLRMAGRCEKYKLRYQFNNSDSYAYDDEATEYEKVFKANKYYRQIEKEYPDDYDALISNCYSFDEYFEAYKR